MPSCNSYCAGRSAWRCPSCSTCSCTRPCVESLSCVAGCPAAWWRTRCPNPTLPAPPRPAASAGGFGRAGQPDAAAGVRGARRAALPGAPHRLLLPRILPRGGRSAGQPGGWARAARTADLGLLARATCLAKASHAHPPTRAAAVPGAAVLRCARSGMRQVCLARCFSLGAGLLTGFRPCCRPRWPCCGAGSGFASWRSLLSALGDRVADELDAANLYRWVHCRDAARG